MKHQILFRNLLCGLGLVTCSIVGCDADKGSEGTKADKDGGMHSTDDTGEEMDFPFAMHVVDVGSGVAVFVAGADFAIVYDAGSSDDTALGEGNRFTSYLRAIRPDLRRIDHMILSHPHDDHMTLMPDVFSDYEIGEVWDSGASSVRPAYHNFLIAAADSDAIYHSAVNDEGSREVPLLDPGDDYPESVTLPHGDRIVNGLSVGLESDAEMTFLHADGRTLEEENENYPNFNSLVVRLDLGGQRILLMGDAHAGSERDPSEPPDDGSVEAALLEDPAAIDADALLVGYHGWRAGSRIAFLDAVSPEVSVIPSFPLFAPPDEEVIAALETYGSVFRTDEDDADCATDPAKTGPDADGRLGGCANVRVAVDDEDQLVAEYLKPAD